MIDKRFAASGSSGTRRLNNGKLATANNAAKVPVVLSSPYEL